MSLLCISKEEDQINTVYKSILSFIAVVPLGGFNPPLLNTTTTNFHIQENFYNKTYYKCIPLLVLLALNIVLRHLKALNF